jgi:hypothetical protein
MPPSLKPLNLEMYNPPIPIGRPLTLVGDEIILDKDFADQDFAKLLTDPDKPVGRQTVKHSAHTDFYPHVKEQCSKCNNTHVGVSKRPLTCEFCVCKKCFGLGWYDTQENLCFDMETL